MKTIKELTEIINEIKDLSDERWIFFERDKRKGVQNAVKRRQKQLHAIQKEEERLERMLTYERKAYQKGYQMVAGIDEVGRGPLAGPVVAACVILPQNCKIMGLNDSKKIPKSKHLVLYETIKKEAIAIGIGSVDNRVIDQINIYEATKVAMQKAIDDLSQKADFLLIDAMTLDNDIDQESIIKGDATSLSIAAASIVAKVTRDQLMSDYNRLYPGYDFDHNAGYGTPKHLDGLSQNGPSPIHRLSFEPVKSLQSRFEE